MKQGSLRNPSSLHLQMRGHEKRLLEGGSAAWCVASAPKRPGTRPKVTGPKHDIAVEKYIGFHNNKGACVSNPTCFFDPLFTCLIHWSKRQLGVPTTRFPRNKKDNNKTHHNANTHGNQNAYKKIVHQSQMRNPHLCTSHIVLSSYLSICLSVCLPIYLSVCLSVYLSIQIAIYLSIRMQI